MKILIIDDCEIFTEFIYDELLKKNHSILVSSLAVLDSLEINLFDPQIIFCDIVMPDFDCRIFLESARLKYGSKFPIYI